MQNTFYKGLQMLRSLWSGVSGMQAHQVALDVESNNIANVNTNGFKYSRADFSTMISQTRRAATIPYGGYGGVNDYSVGLGTGIETTTKVFSQGSLQNTDRKADLALSGMGMFVVSNNGGYTNMYSRDGAFMFDAVGNFVNTSGFIVQGWVRDLSKLGCACGEGELNRVDSTGPIGNIQIDPRLTIPAKATTEVQGNINLTSGNKTENLTCPSPLSSDSATVYRAGALDREYDTNDTQLYVEQDMGVMFNEAGDAMRLQEGQGIWVSYETAETPPISLIDPAQIGAGGWPINTTVVINGETITWTTQDPAASGSSIITQAIQNINRYTEDTGVEAINVNNQIVLQNKNQKDGDDSNKNIVATDFDNGVFNGNTGQFPANAGAGNYTVTTAFQYNYTTQTNADSAASQFRTTEDLRALIEQDANRVKIFGGDSAAHAAGLADFIANADDWSVEVTLNKTGQFELNNHDDGLATNPGQAFTVNNPANSNLNIFVSAFYDDLNTTNVLFKDQMKAMNTGVLVEGGTTTTTAGLRMAKYAQTIEIYDSLGNKHEMQVQFTKVANNQWSWRAVVPEPAEFVGTTPQRPNIIEDGSVTFGENGELLGFNPSTIQFKPNNGAATPQNVSFDFGTSGGFDGLTSTAAESYSNSMTGNGYASGTLSDYYFDATGTMIGIFNNGQNLALAQVAVATFANYEGLQESGSNLYSESPNSGQATIGAAGTGGRAGIEASKLEMSNTDLSRGLTQLIVVQRGFQASSKSITTSDQVLNTLLGLKQ